MGVKLRREQPKSVRIGIKFHNVKLGAYPLDATCLPMYRPPQIRQLLHQVVHKSLGTRTEEEVDPHSLVHLALPYNVALEVTDHEDSSHDFVGSPRRSFRLSFLAPSCPCIRTDLPQRQRLQRVQLCRENGFHLGEPDGCAYKCSRRYDGWLLLLCRDL